jgi:hypothetical protein
VIWVDLDLIEEFVNLLDIVMWEDGHAISRSIGQIQTSGIKFVVFYVSIISRWGKSFLKFQWDEFSSLWSPGWLLSIISGDVESELWWL